MPGATPLLDTITHAGSPAELTTVATTYAVAHRGLEVIRLDGLAPDTEHELEGFAFRTLPEPGALLATFATVNDVHFGEVECGIIDGSDIGPTFRAPEGGPPYPELMNRAAVAEIAALDPAAVVVKGDLTSNGTQAEFEAGVAHFNMRVRRQAEKALRGLDLLTACAAGAKNSVWKSSLDYTHVGFLGFSFGGATAAEASALDSRIAAVANLDGNFFGQAFTGGVRAPYLFVMSGRSFGTCNRAVEPARAWRSSSRSPFPRSKYACSVTDVSRPVAGQVSTATDNPGLPRGGTVRNSGRSRGFSMAPFAVSRKAPSSA